MYCHTPVALQGVDLGRPLGHWFGPNNMAQVIKYVTSSLFISYSFTSEMVLFVEKIDCIEIVKHN